MSLAFVEVPSREAATALVQAIGAQPRYASGGLALPRCDHPRWRLRGPALAQHLRRVQRRGIVRPCVCPSADEPSPRCPHVTWQAASVIELADGTVLVQLEEAALAELAEPPPTHRALTPEEREASEEPWTLRAERRAAEDE